MANQNQKPEPVELEVVGEIELPQYDVRQHIGKKVVIKDKPQAYEGQNGYYIRIESEPLDFIEKSNGEKIPVRASVVFGLHTDVNGKLGWGKNTKLGLFLAKNKLAHYNDVVGKEFIAQIQVAKDGKEYLTFA